MDYISFDNVDPQALKNDFAKQLPVEFEVLNSAIFKYQHFRVSALGVTRVQTDKNKLNTAGFNHLGVLLFDLALNNDKVESRYVFPEFNKRGDFAAAILKDIKKVYFERIPGSQAVVSVASRKITFRDNTVSGNLEYVFCGEGRFLSEKNYYENNKKIWSVSYFDYTDKSGKVYPKYIVLRHFKYKYSLIIKLKEIRV
jgi:hypothetical protein